MGGVSYLVRHHGAADARMFGPADHARFEEGAVDDQLPAAFEQIEQAHLTLGSVKFILLLHSQPRHSPTLGGQRISSVSQLFLLHEELLTCTFPLLRGHDFSI